MKPAPQELRTYFVSTATETRRRVFQTDANALLLTEVLFHYRDQNKFALHAFVIMPDHIHLLLTPAPDIALEKALQLIKGGSSFRLKQKFGVWERRYNESQILDPQKYSACARYIELNPVREKLTASAEEFPYSSARMRSKMDPAPKHLQ